MTTRYKGPATPEPTPQNQSDEGQGGAWDSAHTSPTSLSIRDPLWTGTEEGPVWSSAQSVTDGEGPGEAPSRGTVLAGRRPMGPRPAQVLWLQRGQRVQAWGAFLPDHVAGGTTWEGKLISRKVQTTLRIV